MTLTDIFRRFKWAFVLTISLVIIEELAWIIEPAVFGRLLDALIGAAGMKGGAQHLKIFGTLWLWLHTSSVVGPLLLWAGVFGVNSGAGAIRRSVDEKIYLNMFTKIAVDVADSCESKGLDVARSASRVELCREYVSFLKKELPNFVGEFFDLGGTIIALYFFDWRLSLSCLCIGVPLFFISRLYNNKVIRLEADLHDLREDVFRIFGKKDRQEVRAYYDSAAVPQRKIANLGAVNFGMLRLFLLGIFLVILLIVIDIDYLSTGQIYAVVAYLWTFIGSVQLLPELMEGYTSIKEIQERVRKEPSPESA